jgi:glycosyltransferase involved in cell wall biosynthesis
MGSNLEKPLDVTVVILTFNEARHIARAIASVRSFASEILVVDSFSVDDTTELAEKSGARVLQHVFVSQSQQFQWALDNGGIATGWTLRLDADEVIESDLAKEICQRLPSLPSTVVGVNFDRKHVFMGKWIRHGGRYPLRLLRLWRTGQGRVEDRWMDEHIIVWGGGTVTFKGGFADKNENDLTFFTAKHNSYATREAIDVLMRRYRIYAGDNPLSTISASRQAGTKRWIKERLYNPLPLWAGPLLYFLYRYVFLLGFLDGRTGTIYHVLQGFWYRYLVACKVYEYDRVLKRCGTPRERLEALSQLTGYDLSAAGHGRAGWTQD